MVSHISSLMAIGNALLQAIGKPHGAATFRDLADKFIETSASSCQSLQ